MHRFFVNRHQITDNEIIIEGEDVKHISQVLRLDPGKKIVICDGQGMEYCCIIKTVSTSTVKNSILSMVQSKNELNSKIYLFQGIPKQDKMTFIIQKSTELGVHKIIPVVMTRSIVKINNQNKGAKVGRWQKISEAAAKQAQRGIIPEIESPLSFQEALAYAGKLDKIIVPYENADGIKYSKQVIESITKNESIGIFIGPEGGFDENEIIQLKEMGSHVITLGKRILRTETAGIAILSTIMFHIEEE